MLNSFKKPPKANFKKKEKNTRASYKKIAEGEADYIWSKQTEAEQWVDDRLV